jgi:hypothetical protein
LQWRVNVRFGSKADISECPIDVSFTPESGHPIHVPIHSFQRASDRHQALRELFTRSAPTILQQIIGGTRGQSAFG